MAIVATGFTPGAPVRFAGEGSPFPVTAVAASDGWAAAGVPAPSLRAGGSRRIQRFDVAASDGAITASTAVSVIRPGLRIVDRGPYARLRRRVRVSGQGLEPGRPVWIHVLAGNRREVARLRVVRRAGACGDFSRRMGLFTFRRRATLTRLRYQFDSHRALSRRRRPRATADYLRRVAAPAIGFRAKMIGPLRVRFFG